MVRSAASKVMWVGRATVFLVGLAVILALVFGAATTALGANGNPFLLGKSNAATALSKLTGNVNGSALQVANSNDGTNDTALDLRVQAGEAPMKVNSPTKVARLNADKVDGKDSTALWSGEAYTNLGDATLLAGGALGEGIAHCDPGDAALSGGYRLNDSDLKVIQEFTRHTYSPNYHVVTWDTTGAGVTDKGGTVYVHCADFGSPHQY